MSTLSRVLFLTAAVFIVAAVAQTYWHTMVLRDFVIVNDVEAEEEL
jgi:hypothetical protein